MTVHNLTHRVNNPVDFDAFIRWEDEINHDIEQQIQIFGVNMLSIMLFSSLLVCP